MAQQNGTNGTEVAEVKTTALDGAKTLFEKRAKPADDKAVLGALKNYFKVDEELVALQDKVVELMAKRTELLKEVVALRGTSQINIAGKGVGRIMSRGDSAWITFPSADAGPAISLG